MAEFLVVAQSATHADPDKDERGSYKRGDVVVVQPDGHQWGRLETAPKFVVVKVPDVTVEQARRFIEAEGATEVDPFTGTSRFVVSRRRRWRVRVDDVPLAIRNVLRDTGEVTVSYAQVRPFLENKTTLAVADAAL